MVGRDGQTLDECVLSITAGNRVGNDPVVDADGTSVMPRRCRADVADADAIDAPAGTERGDVDPTRHVIITNSQPRGTRGANCQRADRSVLEQDQALDGLESESFESRPGLHAQRTGADRVVPDEPKFADPRDDVGRRG